MKLTKSKLKEMIREEIQRLNEGYAYEYYRMDMSPEEEDFLDGIQYELEKLYSGKEKQIDKFIISLLDVQSHEEWLDKYTGISKRKILQYVKSKGLKPLRSPIK